MTIRRPVGWALGGAFLLAACGGRENVHDPSSMSTPQPGGAAYAEQNARVSTGAVTASPSEAPAGSAEATGPAPAATTAAPAPETPDSYDASATRVG